MTHEQEGLGMQQNLNKYKPLVLFFIKTLAVFFFFFLLKVLHRHLIDPSFWAYLPALEKMDLYLLFSDAISYPAKGLLTLFGNEVVISERVICVPGYRGVEIQGPCMGLDVFATFIALIIAYPSKTGFSKKVLYIIGGIIIIHILNIFRVSALIFKNIKWENVEVNHHDIFNFIVYGVVLLMFYFWIKFYSKTSGVSAWAN